MVDEPTRSLGAGDRAFVIDTADGILVTPYDPTFADVRRRNENRGTRLKEVSKRVARAFEVTDEEREPIWLTPTILAAIHFDQILQHGGARGIRDHGLIESALSRPIHKWNYEKSDIVVLAAAYGFGIAKNHGFEDGNKRTAFLAVYTFLGLNGFEINAPGLSASPRRTRFTMSPGATPAIEQGSRARSRPAA